MRKNFDFAMCSGRFQLFLLTRLTERVIGRRLDVMLYSVFVKRFSSLLRRRKTTGEKESPVLHIRAAFPHDNSHTCFVVAVPFRVITCTVGYQSSYLLSIFLVIFVPSSLVTNWSIMNGAQKSDQ